MDRIHTSWRAILISVLLSAVTLTVYWPLLRSQFISFDDAQYVTENRHVLSGLKWENIHWAFITGRASNWHPLTWMSHMLDVQLFDLTAGLHHLTNLLFHTANSILLFLLLRRTTRAEWRSAFVAALFALHPLHVESVAWIAERKDVLSTFFMLLTLWAYANYVQSRVQSPESKVSGSPSPRPSPQGEGVANRSQSSEVGGQRSEARAGWEEGKVQKAGLKKGDGTRAAQKSSPSPRPSPQGEGEPVRGQGPEVRGQNSVRSSSLPSSVFYVFSLLFFALGLMSKPMLVTLPFVLLLLDAWPLERLRVGELRVESAESANRLDRRWKPSAIWPLVLEKLPFFCLAAASSAVTFLVQQAGHSVSTTEGLSIEARLANAVASYFKYLSKTFWPVDLAVFYPHPNVKGPMSDAMPDWQVFAAAALLLAITIAAVVRLKRDPWLATGWFWYLGTLVPVIGIVQVGGQAMADRYTYVPLIGVFICLVWGATEFLGNRSSAKMALSAAGVAAVVACGVVSARHVGYWKDDMALFAHAAAVTKHNPIAHYTLGLALGRDGKLEESMAELRLAIEADPSYPDSYYTMAENLAEQGKLEEAIEQYRTALRLRPYYGKAHNNLGAMLWRVGQRDEALKEYAEALRYDPESVETHYNYGVALSSEGGLADAAAQFSEVLRIEPGNVMALTHLAEVRAKQGKLADAEPILREVIRIQPTNAGARVNLAEMLNLAGKRDEAIEQYTNAIRLKPDSGQAHYELAALLMDKGNFADAAAHYSNAARLRPDYADVHTGLGRALALQGKFPEARAQFEEALLLNPTNAEIHVTLANAFLVAGQTNDAAAHFAEAMRLQPDLFDTNMKAAATYEANGQIAQALARLSIAVCLKPADADAHQKFGLLLARQGKVEDAIAQFRETARLRPDAQAYYNLALALVMHGEAKEAVTNYQEAIKLKPDWTEPLNDLAWLLATHPKTEVRNGTEAVRLAEHACQIDGQQARYWGTLAAAYGEAGRFDEAVKTADKAVALATTAGQNDLAEKNRQLEERYKAKKPYHEGDDR